MTDLTAITTPYGLLDRETQEALKAHGGPWEVFTGKRWEKPRSNFFDDPDPAFVIRVKPAPPKPRELWLRINHNGEVRECTEDAEGASLWREVELKRRLPE